MNARKNNFINSDIEVKVKDGVDESLHSVNDANVGEQITDASEEKSGIFDKLTSGIRSAQSGVARFVNESQTASVLSTKVVCILKEKVMGYKDDTPPKKGFQQALKDRPTRLMDLLFLIINPIGILWSLISLDSDDFETGHLYTYAHVVAWIEFFMLSACLAVALYYLLKPGMAKSTGIDALRRCTSISSLSLVVICSPLKFFSSIINARDEMLKNPTSTQYQSVQNFENSEDELELEDPQLHDALPNEDTKSILV
jgi:hypothetical protein